MERQVRLHDVLALEAAKGCPWAMNELLREYQPLIIKYSRALVAGMESTSVDDLKQTASLVLMELTHSYNIEVAGFMTFLYRYLPLRIRRMADGEFQDRMVSPPAHVLRGDRNRYRKTGEAVHHLHATVGICGRVSPEGGEMAADEFLALIAPEACNSKDLDAGLLAQQVWAAVGELNSSDRTLIRLYYGGEGMTLEEIGAELGKSRQAINTALAKALAKLRNNLLGPNHANTDRTTSLRVRSIKAATKH